jgi:c-di-GMP-binding flagellar brake protein YcgR
MQSASPLTVGNPCFLSAHGRTCIVEVLGVSNGTIWVTFPWAVPLDEGTGVELMFQQDDGHVAFHTRVGSALGTPVGLMLERAESCADGQRRRDWRVTTDYPVWLRTQGSTEKLKGRMRDLTANGTMVTTSSHFEPGDLVEMVYQLPEFSVNRLVAQVVYSDTTDENGVNRYGLRFVHVNPRARESIMWFLYDRIQSLYNEELREMYPANPARTGLPPGKLRELAMS